MLSMLGLIKCNEIFEWTYFYKKMKYQRKHKFMGTIPHINMEWVVS